jgi:hypothetical protein
VGGTSLAGIPQDLKHVSHLYPTPQHMVFGTLRPEADSVPGRAIPKGARASIRSRSRLPTFRKFLYTRSGERGYASGPEPLGTPALRFADRLFGLVALFLRPVELVLDVVLNPPGGRPPRFLGGGLLVLFPLAPASTGCLVHLVPDVVLDASLGHIQNPPFFFRGLHRNKNRPVFFRAALPSKQNPTFWLFFKCTMARAGASQGPVPIGVRGCRNVGPRCPARLSTVSRAGFSGVGGTGLPALRVRILLRLLCPSDPLSVSRFRAASWLIR